jgi:hypothetical protein
MKNALTLMLAGALAGLVVASLVVPPLLGWYAEPGGLPKGASVQAVVNIPDVIRYATSRLLRGQAIGAGLGALAGLTAYMLWRSGRNKAPLPEPRRDVGDERA